jgi:hypothetical protein
LASAGMPWQPPFLAGRTTRRSGAVRFDGSVSAAFETCDFSQSVLGANEAFRCPPPVPRQGSARLSNLRMTEV